MTPADRADWLSWRRGDGTTDAPTLGATDCAAVLAARLGWHTYRGPADIYAERWHGRPVETDADRLSDKAAILEIGQRLEPYILERWHHRHGATPAPGPRLQLPALPWWRGSLDAAPVMADGRLTIVDAKTYRWSSAGHWHDAADRPVWPAVYLCQLAQYAVVCRALGIPVEAITLAALDVGDATLSERAALLSDPVSLHIDPDLVCPVDADGAPLTVEALGLACLATGADFRATYLLGASPPCPPPDGPVADWWAARPRPRPSSRPATEAEADSLATYLIAHTAEKEAKATKAQTKAEIVRLMTEGDPVARIYCDLGSVSINEGGRITVTAKR